MVNDNDNDVDNNDNDVDDNDNDVDDNDNDVDDNDGSDNDDLELTTYFSEIRALVEDSTPNKMKSPIHESLTVTMLKIYGDYEEEKAIEAGVIKSPSESSDELRQIIYSL